MQLATNESPQKGRVMEENSVAETLPFILIGNLR